tara:strand:- start:363 stop:899 length:537 start_codon:yes stop_codon:yes gene_type:complete
MISREDEPLLDAPIPGQSLTAELGGRPWQKPSEMNTLEDAIDYYIPRLGDPSQLNTTLGIIDSGTPLTTIAEILTLSGTMEGKHNVDMAVLVNPVIVEFLKGLGDMAGIKYTLDTEDGYKDKDITEVDSVKAEKELLQEDVDSLVNEVTDNDNVEEEPVAIENQTEDEPKGLMARRTM